MKARNTFGSRLAQGLVALVASLSLIACTKGSSSSSSSSSSLTVSGSLTQASASGLLDPVSRFQQNFSTTGTSLSLDCGAAGIFSATVDPTTGAFSASGVPAGVPCTFSFVGTDSGAIKCSVSFQDPTALDLNNNPMSTSTATATSNVVLGAIICDTSGNVTINSASIPAVNSSTSVAAATAFDFTGTWTAAVFPGALPAGYVTATPNCTSNCNGPSVGDLISLVRFHGQGFTPSAGHCTPGIG